MSMPSALAYGKLRSWNRTLPNKFLHGPAARGPWTLGYSDRRRDLFDGWQALSGKNYDVPMSYCRRAEFRSGYYLFTVVTY